MSSSKGELIAILTKECELYSAIPANQPQQKRDKKNFINGLMTASRIVGISYDELNAIVDAMPKLPEYRNLDEKLSIPIYVRNNVEIMLPQD